MGVPRTPSEPYISVDPLGRLIPRLEPMKTYINHSLFSRMHLSKYGFAALRVSETADYKNLYKREKEKKSLSKFEKSSLLYLNINLKPDSP